MRDLIRFIYFYLPMQLEIPFEEYKSRQLELPFNSDLFNNLKEWTDVEDAEKKSERTTERVRTKHYDAQNVEKK